LVLLDLAVVDGAFTSRYSRFITRVDGRARALSEEAFESAQCQRGESL
jgi:hypothetical protein